MLLNVENDLKGHIQTYLKKHSPLETSVGLCELDTYIDTYLCNDTPIPIYELDEHLNFSPDDTYDIMVDDLLGRVLSGFFDVMSDAGKRYTHLKICGLTFKSRIDTETFAPVLLLEIEYLLLKEIKE
jgi:hypothetical protein